MCAFSSSTVPYASIRGCVFGTRLMSPRCVSPESPEAGVDAGQVDGHRRRSSLRGVIFGRARLLMAWARLSSRDLLAASGCRWRSVAVTGLEKRPRRDTDGRSPRWSAHRVRSGCCSTETRIGAIAERQRGRVARRSCSRRASTARRSSAERAAAAWSASIRRVRASATPRTRPWRRRGRGALWPAARKRCSAITPPPRCGGLRPGVARPVHVTIAGRRGCPAPPGVTVHRSRRSPLATSASATTFRSPPRLGRCSTSRRPSPTATSSASSTRRCSSGES